ncbi:hypothetical protein [Falsiporphyromonas endometrii]|uniref:Uncharacterized protein n=1 Tax=Falsiporphyromonas endometrii TaxID=1387297 RepID=A0ABV9K8W1_9PORP
MKVKIKSDKLSILNEGNIPTKQRLSRPNLKRQPLPFTDLYMIIVTSNDAR